MGSGKGAPGCAQGGFRKGRRMMSAQAKVADEKRYGKGKSKSAIRRREQRQRVTLLTGKPGQTIKASDRIYIVQRDGSFRVGPKQ